MKKSQEEAEVKVPSPEHPKFFTDEETHERAKAALKARIDPKLTPKLDPKLAPKTAAADPEWIKEWVKHNGPYLRHGTTPEAYDKILKDGLLPHDRGPGSQYDEHLVPREDSVYMAPDSGRSYPANLYIDLRKLNPENFIEDEDQMHNALLRPGPDPFTHLMGHKMPDSMVTYGIGRRYHGVKTDNGDEFAHHGQWADEHEEGERDTPDRVARSLNGARVHKGMSGTIAHRGAIPPEAIIQEWQYKEEEAQNKWGHGALNTPHRIPHPSQLAYQRANPGAIVDHFKTLKDQGFGAETNHIYPIHLDDENKLHIGSGRHQTLHSITGGLHKDSLGLRASNLRGAGSIEQVEDSKGLTVVNFENGVHDGDHSTHGGVTHEQAQHVQKLLKGYYGHDNVEYDTAPYRASRTGAKEVKGHNGWHFAHETDSMSPMKIANKPRKSPGAHVKAHWGKHPKAMKKLK